MTRGTLIVLALLALLGAPGRRSLAAEPSVVGVRAGDHHGFGRVVFDLPRGVEVETAIEGDRVLLVFSGASRVGAPGALPHNVVAASVDRLTAVLSTAPGSRPRLLRMGDRLVVDVFDPEPRGSEPAPEARAAPVRDATTPVRERAIADLRPAPGGRTPGRANSRPARAPSATDPLDPRRPGTTEAKSAGPPRLPEPAPVEPRAAETRPVAPASGEPKTAEPKAVAPGSPDREPAKAIVVSTAPGSKGTPVEPAPVVPVERVDLSDPVAPAPSRDDLRPAAPGIAVSLPADPSIGAAAFRRGASAYVVLDRRLSLAVPAGLEGATVLLGPTTTVLAFPLGADQALRLGRTQAAWTVELGGPDATAPMRLEGGTGGLLFALAHPGRSVSILDPTTGGALLVGTSLTAGPETSLTGGPRGPGYVVVPTWLGVAVEPLADVEELRAGARGFVLRPSAAASVTAAEAPGRRRFEFLDEPTPSLLNRLNGQMASAALSPPRARAAPRLAAAQTMLALGLDVEAQALLKGAMAEDPQAAADAQLPALAAVAAVLAGRLDEADALDDPRIQDSPEILLWRGLRDRRQGRETDAARALPDGMALARSYPPAIRTRIWPDLAEAAVDAGRALPPDETPPYAAALRLERLDKVDEALRAWQAIADGGDRADSVRATRKLVELELAAGRIEPGAAADLLERQAIGWRGDSTELALRLRAAELRAAAGQWREALDLLRATDPLFPDRREEIRRHKTAAFETMLARDGSGLSPLDLILLASDYADCVPDDESGAKLAALLADKLAALDLPARAIPVLQGLVKAKAPGPARAQFAVRLGAMMMETGDAAGALTALAASDADGLPAPLIEERALLRARAHAALSHDDLALAALRELDTPRADDLRATLLGKAGDWRGCLAALTALEARVVPAAGPLDPAAQAVIVRQAEAAQQIPDLDRLQSLRRWLPRMSGAPADLLRMLTSPPVTAATELPRARTELALARTLPKHFEGMARP